MLIRIGRYHAINTAQIVGVRIEQDGPVFVVSMTTGESIRIAHTIPTHQHDGFDVYQAFDQLVRKMEG